MRKTISLILLTTLSLSLKAQEIPIQGVFLSRVAKEIKRDKGDSLLVDYLKRHELNTIAVYEALSSSKRKRNQVEDFKAKVDSISWDTLSWMGIGSSPKHLHRADSLKDDYQYVFLENEWWKKFWGYNRYRKQLFQLEINPPNRPVVLYLGWLSRKPFKAKQQAYRIVEQADYLAVHVYMKEPSPGYVRERLHYIAEAAKLQNKTQKIIFMFSLEAKFSSTYFIHNSYQEAYLKFMQELLDDEDLSLSLNQLSFEGYLLFSYNRRHQ